MRALRPIALAFGVLVLAAGSAAAQQTSTAETPGELVTDRPDFTESSQTIARGWYQFESGVTYEGDGREARAFSAPAALMRIGLGRNTELRVGADGFVSETFAGVRTSGVSDIELGFKTQLLNQERHGIDFAVLPAISLPTGGDGFSSGSADPSVKLTWGRDLPAGFGMTGNVNFASFRDDAGRYGQEAVTLSFGHDLVAGFGAYAEVYGMSRLARGESAAWTVNGGVTHPVGANMQFDIEAGRGVTAAAPDWFIGAGFAVRSPFTRRR